MLIAVVYMDHKIDKLFELKESKNILL